MCWSKKSSKHQGLKKPALSAHHGSPRTACFPPAPIRANGASVHGVNGHPVSDPPAANWNVQAARAMATDPLTATVRHGVTGTVPSHRVRIAQAGTVPPGVTGIVPSPRARIAQAGTVRRVVTGIVHSRRVRIAQAGTVLRVVTGIVPSHRVRIAQAGIVHRVVTGTGLRAVVVRPSNRVAASRLAADRPVGVADLRGVADHQAEAAPRVVLVRHGVILKQGSATCGLSPDGSKAVL